MSKTNDRRAADVVADYVLSQDHERESFKNYLRAITSNMSDRVLGILDLKSEFVSGGYYTNHVYSSALVLAYGKVAAKKMINEVFDEIE